jgi:hypothetical protein
MGGCGWHTWSTITPLENGYSIVAHYRDSWLAEEGSAHAELTYQDRNGKKIPVWGAVNEVVINGDMAVFTGSYHGTGPEELMVFVPPGPAVDIAMPLTGLAEKQYGWKIPDPDVNTVNVKKLTKRTSGVEVLFYLPLKSQSTILTWDQIADMMREAKKEQGTRR